MNVTVQMDQTDNRIWCADPEGKFCVKSCLVCIILLLTLAFHGRKSGTMQLP